MPARKVLTCPSGKAAANAAERSVVFIGFYKKVPRAERGLAVPVRGKWRGCAERGSFSKKVG